jgi:ubiquinone/menaquinone biosynthesis C-methylase UbiE
MVDLSKVDPATMAQHLGKPEGEIGRALADSMAARNWPVYEAAFRRLGVRPGERIFEVGFGNGKITPRLMELVSGITYTGIDYSEAMVAEAEASNKNLINAGSAEFRHASVEAIPFADGAFDHALTVNTIYFWHEPVRALTEIRRTLRAGGKLFLVAGTPEQMAKNAFTRHGFRLYSDARLRELFASAGFREMAVELYRYQAPALDRSKTVEQEYFFVIGSA